ncbi:hypothetical protein BGX33_000976 [Mortierella sp. NVP41]|nr:hypothetical protein BGX33_000976 [Mortierella sp. NVP41]
MQTRRKKQVAKTESQAESQSVATEDEVMLDTTTATATNNANNHTESIADEHMEALVPEPMPVTPVKTRRRLSEPSPAAATSSPKRAKAKSSASSLLQKYVRTIEVPHSATLTPVVWVFDDKYQWWPGKIKPYPPQNNQARVTRLGNLKPKTITVECLESTILPFGHSSKERFHQAGATSSHARAFREAYKEAGIEQLKDDDGLPSMEDVFSYHMTPSSTPNSPHSPSQKDTVCHKTIRADIEYAPDSSLTIPGELVLALAERSYYPGRIESFNIKSNKYRIELATGHHISVERKKFFTRYERDFQTCPLGEMAKPELNEDFRDEAVESDVVDLYPALYAIVAGTEDEAGRSKAFVKGGKARNQLAQRVGAGDFTPEQYNLISLMLQSEFLPNLVTTKRIARLKESSPSSTAAAAGENHNGTGTVAGGGHTPMKRDGDITREYSDQKRFQFVTDVLLPETITRLTMRRNEGMSYADADSRVLEGHRPYSTDTWWVEDILAARESFLDGRAA